jgi:hypothetical protein
VVPLPKMKKDKYESYKQQLWDYSETMPGCRKLIMVLNLLLNNWEASKCLRKLHTKQVKSKITDINSTPRCVELRLKGKEFKELSCQRE